MVLFSPSFLTSSVSGTWLRDVVHLVVVVLVKYLLILFVPSLERVTAGERVGLSQHVGPSPVFARRGGAGRSVPLQAGALVFHLPSRSYLAV